MQNLRYHYRKARRVAVVAAVLHNICVDWGEEDISEEHSEEDDEHGEKDEEHGEQDEEHGEQDEEHSEQDEEHGEQDEEHSEGLYVQEEREGL